MPAWLELTYFRDSPGWAVDGVLRNSTQILHNLGRSWLERERPGAFQEALDAFNAAYERALRVADSAPIDLDQAHELRQQLQNHIYPAATRLGEVLFPRAMHEFIAGPAAPRIEIVCDADISHVPFEAAWLHGDFLGFRYDVTRRLILHGSQTRRRLRVDADPRCAIVADPGALLSQSSSSTSQKIQTVFQQLLREWTFAGAARRIRLLPASWKIAAPVHTSDIDKLVSSHEIVVLLGHHEADAPPGVAGVQGPGRGLQIGPDQFYSADQLRKALASNGNAPWLLFSPSCGSATGDAWRRHWRNGDDYSLAGAALRGGIPNFIGTLFEVHAEYVAAMARPLLDSIEDGRPLAESLRAARCALRGLHPRDPFHPGTLPGMAFVLLGGTSQALLGSTGARLDYNTPAPPATHWCEHKEPHGDCGRAISPEEPGHPSRRCNRHFIPTPPGGDGPFCNDEYKLHPGEQRSLSLSSPGYGDRQCPDCWNERRRRLSARKNGGK